MIMKKAMTEKFVPEMTIIQRNYEACQQMLRIVVAMDLRNDAQGRVAS
jgi:hypothetical protein